MGCRDEIGVVTQRAARARILQQGAKIFAVGEQHLRIACHNLKAEIARAGLHYGDGLRMTIGIDQKTHGRILGQAPRHGHRFGRSGRLVQHRSVGDVHAGQVDDHLLKVEQRLEAALADLGLIGRVGGIPARILQHVALDHFRHERAVVAHADHRNIDAIAFAHGAQMIQHRAFADGIGQAQR